MELRGYILIVSASRSPPGLDSKGSTFGAHFRLAPKRIDFWRSFSHSGLFLEPFLAYVWFIFQLFWLIFRSWAHFGSAGGPLFHHKNGLDHQRRPNRHFPQNIVTFWGPFWSHFSSIFRFLGLCFWASFFVEFRDRFFMDFGFIPAQFFDIFSTCRHLWF